VRLEGDWEAWIEFFLEGVVSTAQNAVETAQRLVALFKHDSERVQAMGRVANTALRVFHALCEHPLLTLSQAQQRTGLSFPATAKGMKVLTDLGIAREITGHKRNRIFAYDRYLNILSEGTEPL
jgi:Fic family protein